MCVRVRVRLCELAWWSGAQVAWAAVGAVLAGYLHYVVSVIHQICDFLGINCLTIAEPAKEVKLQ